MPICTKRGNQEMILQADVKGLEIAVAAWLAQDQTLIQELHDKVDIHGENQKAFGLPTRLIAKVLGFRILYGGSAYAFAQDPAFKEVSTDKKYWQKAIDAYYKKYHGIEKWHRNLVYEATTTGRVLCPTGRFFPFKPEFKNGEMQWHVQAIKNYPVQGTGADLVSLARVEFYRMLRITKLNVKPVATVHDSIVVDCHPSEIQKCAKLLQVSIERIPALFKRRFGSDVNVPFTSEITAGPNFKDLNEIEITI